MTTKKYEILHDQTIEHEGRTLYRIRRLSDGLIGGWIEAEDNLSHEGRCFVFHDAKVYDNAKVSGGALVGGDAEVYGNAKVLECATLRCNAKVGGEAKVFGYADVRGETVATVDVIFKAMPRDDITVTDHHIGVGCETHTFDHWEKHIEEIGQKHGYSVKQIALYKETIFALIAQRRAQGF